MCAAKIAARRTSELAEILARAEADGAFVSLVTLTMRHTRGDLLAELWDGLASAWGAVTSGKQWQRLRDEIGVSWARAVEATHGKNGWHVHVHAVMVTKVDPAGTDLAGHIWRRWSRALERSGFDADRDRGGFDFKTAARGDAQAVGAYVAKMGGSGLAEEAMLGAFKKARQGNRTPFQIAHDLGETGDMDDVELWWEWERAAFGRRLMTYSKALRESYAVGPELTDEEIAQEETGDDRHAVMDGDAWKVARPHAARILDVCERDGVDAALDLLTSLGVGWARPVVDLALVT